MRTPKNRLAAVADEGEGIRAAAAGRRKMKEGVFYRKFSLLRSGGEIDREGRRGRKVGDAAAEALNCK